MNDRQKKLLGIIKMSDTTSLPTQDSDPDDSDLATYVVRITPHEKFVFQQVVDFLNQEPYFLNFVISKETVPQEHYHIVIQTDTTFTTDDVRGAIRAFIIPFWQTDQLKLPRGFGNKQYNLQESDNCDKAVSYAVKLGEYVFEGFTDEYINQRKAESFDKKKPSNFKSEYNDLCKSFQDSNMDIRQFMINYCDLKAKYDQSVNLHHAYNFALGQEIKRDKNASDHVENFLYKV